VGVDHGTQAVIVPVLWCSKHPDILARGYADQGLLEAIMDRTVWTPRDPITFEHHNVRDDFPDVAGAVVVINCRTHASPNDVAWFKGQLDRLSWAVVLLCGDEEWVFPWQEIPETDTRRVWVMQARPEHKGLSGFLPGGWYPGTRDHLRAADPEGRPLEWFFGGQVTHIRRRLCTQIIRGMPYGRLVQTKGYLQEAVPKAEYFRLMASAKVIPCPSGPHSVDCARTFEALEAGCVPVADTVTADGAEFDYWTLLFDEEPPFPRITDWSTYPDVHHQVIQDWPGLSARTFAWWQQKKRQLALRLEADIRAASGQPQDLTAPDDRITVIVTTSPVPSHPSTEHIEATVASIREQLPTAEIVITVDGVRPEQVRRQGAYSLYVRRLLWLCNYEWHNVVPVVMGEWKHQALSTRAALELVDTPLILFVEHDTPLVGEIPWAGLADAVTSGAANVIRFHQDVSIHEDHERVMLDTEPRIVKGVPLRRTAAWWQRPHLASTEFYRCLLGRFSPSARTMIEEPVYAAAWSDIEDRGEAGWGDWRLWIYQPPGDMRRSGHLDSRGDDPKFRMWT
jgi:hypothetical protein